MKRIQKPDQHYATPKRLKTEENQCKEKLSCDPILNLPPVNDVCNDTEAAIHYVKNLLISSKDSDSYSFPPVVFVHQLRDIVKNKTVLNHQIELLRNENKIILINLGNVENTRVVVLVENLKNQIFINCDASQKLVYKNFFDRVLSSTVDIGITRKTLLSKYRFSEKELSLLVSSGLLILKETGVLWFSFPHAGAFVRRIIKGRQTLLNLIKKKKYQEILELDLENAPRKKSLTLPIMYHIHDLVGGNFVNCIQTSAGRILRYRS